MTENEIFKFPTVKEVIFQIVYPDLFLIENKIGEFQIRIMNEFPDSSLIYRRHLLFADLGPESKISEQEMDSQKAKKIWQFKSDKGYKLAITTGSLSIVSSSHKSYNKGEDNFRNIIKLVLENFFDLIPVTRIKRIGLRYLDECPLPKLDVETFSSYYNSAFPLKRFSMTQTKQMQFVVEYKKDKYFLKYSEYFNEQRRNVLILDFDGFANDIEAINCLSVLDDLHKIISKEYFVTIKEPVKEYMRTGKISDKNES